VFNTVGDVTGINATEPKFDELETTHLNSPTDAQGNVFKEFMYGLLDPGSIALDVNFTGTDAQDQIIEACGTLKNFEWHMPQVVTTAWPNGVKIEFSANVGYLLPKPDPKNVLKATLQLRNSGAYTFTAL
jgi:hypothetical protein